MTQVITVSNQKGGVGKTTTATFLASKLQRDGHKTLLIDLDPQGNATDTYNLKGEYKTSYDLLQGEYGVQDIAKNELGDIIPSDLMLAAADMQFVQHGREYKLKKMLEQTGIGQAYEYIIVDTPPTLGILTINAFTASGRIIVPLCADRYSLQGIMQLAETIDSVREYSNPSIVVDGMLLTKFKSRTLLAKHMTNELEQIANALKTKMYTRKIRDSVIVQEAQAEQMFLLDYAGNSPVCDDYNLFVDELMEGLRNGKAV